AEGACARRGRKTCSSAIWTRCTYTYNSGGSVVREDRDFSGTFWSLKSSACCASAFIDIFESHRLKRCRVENRICRAPQGRQVFPLEVGSVFYPAGDSVRMPTLVWLSTSGASSAACPYHTLASYYAFLGNRNDAIATWQRLQSLASDDPDLAPNLGGLFMAEKRYPEAASLFEAAALANPADAYAQLRLGMVRLRSHNTDQGMKAMHKALQIDPGAEMLNDVAYEM